MLDRITKVIAIGTAALIFLSFYDLNSYYKYYGIPINDYLNASELILSFSQLNSYNFIQFLFFLTVAFLVVYQM